MPAAIENLLDAEPEPDEVGFGFSSQMFECPIVAPARSRTVLPKLQKFWLPEPEPVEIPGLFVNENDPDWIFKPFRRRSYDVITADPPWKYLNWSKKGEGKNASKHYTCQPLDWIKSLPVRELAKKDCWLFLWATGPCLEQAFEVVRAWGFTYITLTNWQKKTKNGKVRLGPGYVSRSVSEPF